ncbi:MULTISPECIES: type IVB secretion system protein IcmG/DotF [unclassified Legionella]|uniref:type IVB secretion system protein IcmG/DotF n=1 Tax=unclassified Legionella TaxID=2622702 RepID=UPI0010559609|nr:MULTISPECIES: type IVB secretion system protein IcmG/DotF [unclassified Legionella]MDI9817886.1 type IVB secretion system protein IcmG/DotF [Legionella sp. PL877]
MADDKNEYNDEYQFSDLDVISPDSTDEDTQVAGGTAAGETRKVNVRRNALIAVIIIVIVMLAYKFLGPVFTGKTPPDSSVPPLTTATPQPPAPQIQPITPAPIVQAPPPVAPSPTVDSPQINQRLSALELSQQNLRSEMDSVNNQLNSISANFSELASKIAELNQTLTVLASKVEQQSNEIAILTVRTKPKPVKRVVIRRPPPPTYYIQAIIPGRAWLIAQNGSTITVREGTKVVGYGVIKLIDSRQGRVLTSSGRMIRFSQQDS